MTGTRRCGISLFGDKAGGAAPSLFWQQRRQIDQLGDFGDGGAVFLIVMDQWNPGAEGLRLLAEPSPLGLAAASHRDGEARWAP